MWRCLEEPCCYRVRKREYVSIRTLTTAAICTFQPELFAPCSLHLSLVYLYSCPNVNKPPPPPPPLLLLYRIQTHRRTSGLSRLKLSPLFHPQQPDGRCFRCLQILVVSVLVPLAPNTHMFTRRHARRVVRRGRRLDKHASERREALGRKQRGTTHFSHTNHLSIG